MKNAALDGFLAAHIAANHLGGVSIKVSLSKNYVALLPAFARICPHLPVFARFCPLLLKLA